MTHYRDTLVLTAARRLSRQIELFWEKRGYYIHTRVEPTGIKTQAGTELYQVRSDMTGGMPKDYAKAT